MSGLGMKKWRPFNSVVPGRELLKNKPRLSLPDLSDNEIEEFEDVLKYSLYTHSDITVVFVCDGNLETLTDRVLSLDPITKDIVFSSRKINFRQIFKIEK